jgi:hypothetical protein
MANLPTWLGKPPYIGWQNCFCITLDFQDFWAMFFVYKSFYKSLYKFFYKGSHTLWRWKERS